MYTLQEKIDLVKQELFKHFPNCYYTVHVLLWDDNTDWVECRHGDGKHIHSAIYYDNKLVFEKNKMWSNVIALDETGKEFYVLTPEQAAERKLD